MSKYICLRQFDSITISYIFEKNDNKALGNGI